MKTKELLLAATLMVLALQGMKGADATTSGVNAGAKKILAPTPPMGWNSYDAFGSSVTEDEFLANAAYVKAKLLPCGYDTVVVDFRWSDATAANYDPNGIGGPLVADAFGRLLPAPNRFPSAADGKGFKPLADRIHAMGLKFGIHVMRGIPRQSVAANTPIEGSAFKATDAANTKSTCNWCKDMWGIDASKQAGQDYYRSIFRLYASWGVDFVKVDDLSYPYHKEEIEAVRKAIDASGRPMVFSTSPGETPVDQREHIAAHANMWRMARDLWDNWRSLDHLFNLAARWQDVGGSGAWPDADMIPFGKIAIRCVGKPRQSNFTKDEQRMMFSLLALMPSPLMLGMNLPENDPWTESLITDKEVIAINQDVLSKKGVRVWQNGQTEVWVRQLRDNCRAVGFFNRNNAPADVTLSLADAGLAGQFTARDLWQKNDLGPVATELKQTVPAHGVVLLLLKPD